MYWFLISKYCSIMGVMGGAPFLGPALCRSPVCRAGTEKERVPLRIWIVWCGSAAPMCGKQRRNRAGKPRLPALPRSGREGSARRLRAQTAVCPHCAVGRYRSPRSVGSPAVPARMPRFALRRGEGKPTAPGYGYRALSSAKGRSRFGCRWYSPQWQPAQVLQLCVQPEAGGSPVISVIIAPLT